MVEEFEYKQIEWPLTVEQLNNYGKEGWLLVAIEGGSLAYFVRVKWEGE